MMLQQYITQYVHAIWQYGQERLNSSVPLTLLIYENYIVIPDYYHYGIFEAGIGKSNKHGRNASSDTEHNTSSC